MELSHTHLATPNNRIYIPVASTEYDTDQRGGASIGLPDLSHSHLNGVVNASNFSLGGRGQGLKIPKEMALVDWRADELEPRPYVHSHA